MSSSSFPDSFDQFTDESPASGSTQPFENAHLGPYAFSNATDSPAPVYVSDLVDFYSENIDGPILPPPTEMESEEGYALKEWRRENAIRLEEKERREKELLSKILVEADEYKVEFHKKKQVNCEANKTTNREKEKVFVANQERFYAESDKDYWKSIADLIPKEVPAIEKRNGKKEQEKKPSSIVIHGPKTGKPTDLSRMRQIIVKLKHNSPPHLNKPSSERAPDANTDASVALMAPAEAVA